MRPTRPPLEIAPRRPFGGLYFAYGSNLCLEQMRDRCPDATPVRPLALPGYLLRFRTVADFAEGGPAARLCGAIYRLSGPCERNLDYFEGANGFGRFGYDRLEFPDPETGEGVLIYRKVEGEVASPSTLYFRTILAGYADWGIPPAPALAALERAERAERTRQRQRNRSVRADPTRARFDPFDREPIFGELDRMVNRLRRGDTDPGESPRFDPADLMKGNE